MKSSSGLHYPALDHVRALAAFFVFTWHFTHGFDGTPSPFGSGSALPLLDEGHTGVALFMTLSGYLFAKILDARRIVYSLFLWNRLLRLFPLLGLVTVIVFVLRYHNGQIAFIKEVIEGFVLPTWPNGGWSITVELHFYLLLPLLLYLTRRWSGAPFVVVAAAILTRFLIWHFEGSVQYLSYWTIFGRLDQFAMGIAAFHWRGLIKGRHALAALLALSFLAFYFLFDKAGGYYNIGSGSPTFIVLPTIEAISYSLLIAYYDATFNPPYIGASRVVSKIGTYSYSIYLLHVFVVFRAASFIQSQVMDISNFYVALLWSAACFVPMIGIGHLSYHYVELPFLRLRRKYTAGAAAAAVGTT